MELWGTLIIMVFTGAGIGWITNYLAIRLLFRPYKEISVLGFKIQGLVPKRKNELAESIAETVDEHLISSKDITSALGSIETEEEIDKIVNDIVEKKLKKEILAKIPMAAMFINDSLIEKIKKFVKEAIEENKEELIEKIIYKMEENIDLKEIVENKVKDFSLIKLEEIILSLAKKELAHIELIGGILGALIGLVQFMITKVIL